MRIIAGAFRGRRLHAPKGNRIRPTIDWVREAVFNMIATQVPGAKVLDLFAGTGAMGLEALSRGAHSCFFVDNSAEALSLIRENVQLCAALHSSGLLQIDNSPHMDIPDRMDTIEGFGGAIIEEDFETALSGYFHKSPVAKLGIRDFMHVEKDLSILRPFLKKSLKARMTGVNILLYGLPWTGKTELVRMLAEEMGIKLLEVSSQDDEGDPADSDQRFRSYLLCQKLFAKTNNYLILFDEVEDVFPVDDFVFFGPHRRTGNNKAWTNRLLENNPVPAIWVSNSVSQIDPAFVRRFDLVFEVPIPPRSIRKGMIEKHFGN